MCLLLGVIISNCGLRGFAKKFFPKNPSLLWKWVGGSRSHSDFCVENHPKIALNQDCYHVSYIYKFSSTVVSSQIIHTVEISPKYTQPANVQHRVLSEVLDARVLPM